jgi:hypothetical protein
MLEKLNRFLAEVNASVKESERRAERWLEKVTLEEQVQQSPSIKTHGFSSELEAQVVREAADREAFRQAALEVTLDADPLLATLFGMASERFQGEAKSISERRGRDESAMKQALRDHDLIERLRDPEYRAAYEKASRMLEESGKVGESSHYEALTALIDRR